jgi:hypothetical protein
MIFKSLKYIYIYIIKELKAALNRLNNIYYKGLKEKIEKYLFVYCISYILI